MYHKYFRGKCCPTLTCFNLCFWTCFRNCQNDYENWWYCTFFFLFSFFHFLFYFYWTKFSFIGSNIVIEINPIVFIIFITFFFSVFFFFFFFFFWKQIYWRGFAHFLNSLTFVFGHCISCQEIGTIETPFLFLFIFFFLKKKR